MHQNYSRNPSKRTSVLFKSNQENKIIAHPRYIKLFLLSLLMCARSRGRALMCMQACACGDGGHGGCHRRLWEQDGGEV